MYALNAEISSNVHGSMFTKSEEEKIMITFVLIRA